MVVGLRDKSLRAMELLLDRRALVALATWPHFSFTSYRMVSALAAEHIQPRTVIDVGANVGQFTIAAAQLFGPHVSIHAFEPQPECVVRLRHNVRGFPNVAIYEFALADRDGEATFHLNTNHRSSSLLPLAHGHRDSFPAAVEVATTTARVSKLDSVFRSLPPAPPVLLKLDVQGAEAMTLRGGVETLEQVSWVVLEASFRTMYSGEALFGDLARTMEALGFRFIRPVGWLCDPRTGEMLQMDALFARNPARDRAPLSSGESSVHWRTS
jgi:FkbM family methyltransferase